MARFAKTDSCSCGIGSMNPMQIYHLTSKCITGDEQKVKYKKLILFSRLSLSHRWEWKA